MEIILVGGGGLQQKIYSHLRSKKELIWKLIARGEKIGSLKRQKKAIIAYHRVCKEPFNCNPLSPHRNYILSEKLFRDQLEYISKNYKVVPLKEIFANTDDSLVSLTFDDGYRDNYEVVYPILKEYGLPATFFISTAYIGNGTPWWYELEEILFSSSVKVHFMGKQWILKNYQKRRECFDYVFNLLKAKDEEFISSTLLQLIELLKIDSVKNIVPMMDWNMLKKISDSGLVTIGNHTHCHKPFSGLAESKIREEILSADKMIMKKLNTKPNSFSYPFGRRQDISIVAEKILKENGYICAVTGAPGIINKLISPYQLARVASRDYEGMEGFKIRLSVVMAWIGRYMRGLAENC